MAPVYFDCHASCPVDARVHDAMAPFLGPEGVGNAASHHAHGERALAVVEEARRRVASVLGAQAASVVFTSGATESNNLAIKGVAFGQRARGAGDHVITTAIEHSSVLRTCLWLREQGFRVTVLPVARDGRISPEAVARAITPRTTLVTVMHANNEIGVVEPIPAIYAAIQTANLGRRHEVLLHTDACQAFGRESLVHYPAGGSPFVAADLVSISAHKIYGPQGVGALYVRPGLESVLLAQQHGGTHERGLRAGTLAVPVIAGLGAAAAIMRDEGEAEAQRLGALRDRLAEILVASLGEAVVVNGPWEDRYGAPGEGRRRLAHNLHVSFPGVCSLTLMDAVKDKVSVSASSACMSQAPDTSHVVKAIGGMDAEEGATIRFGLGRFTTAAEVEYAGGLFARMVPELVGVGCPVGMRHG